jgi:hypothetical protein
MNGENPDDSVVQLIIIEESLKYLWGHWEVLRNNYG